MKPKSWLKLNLLLSAAAALIYAWFRYNYQRVMGRGEHASSEARRLLLRAAPFIRLPSAPEVEPEVLPDGRGLRCTVTGRIYPYHEGILDLLGQGPALSFTQQTLDAPFTAWLYDRVRPLLLRVFQLPDFPQEVAMIQRDLQLHSGDVLLDLAAGHGNFTVEWAKLVGQNGLVLALDLSPTMLDRAAFHLDEWNLSNVLLIRGDAEHLPLASGSLSKINCSGGFHQFLNLQQALTEIERVSAPNAVLTASAFAEGPRDGLATLKRLLKQQFDLHFISLVQLGEQLIDLGYVDYQWHLPGGWYGYITARKGE